VGIKGKGAHMRSGAGTAQRTKLQMMMINTDFIGLKETLRRKIQ
jgi:hypothetical protein